MPIEVTCELDDDPRLVDRVRECRTIEPLIAAGVVRDGKRTIDVRALLFEEDIYGRTSTFEPSDVELWRTHREIDVFSPADLDTPELAYVLASGSSLGGTLGRLNLDFIRWLKAAAQSAERRVSVSYLHERGDYPYETARWVFDFRVDHVETFTLVSWDGNDEPEWMRRVGRTRSGEVVR